MKIYIGMDDTDSLDSDYGTGKVARWLQNSLPEGCRVWGVVRQQLLVDNRIPYTSHNSSACLVLDADDDLIFDRIVSSAADHIERHAVEGSDPGLCVCPDNYVNMPELIAFSKSCTREVVSQAQAMKSSAGAHLSAHGGTGDGIIGAAAAVGLTACGQCGRFIEYGRLRDLPDPVPVHLLESNGIMVVSVDRQAPLPSPQDLVYSHGWLRPRLWAGKALLPVQKNPQGGWNCIGRKKNKGGSEYGGENLLS